MKEIINPFRLRSSESIESKLTFLKLFGPKILDFLPNDCFSNKVTIFRSGPGGGKTSLFRLFQPESIREIAHNYDYYKDISKYLKKREVIDDESNPQLLGVYLRLFDDYRLLGNLNTKQNSHSYLLSLIGVRLIIKTLTGILDLKKLGLEDLKRITINKPPTHNITNSPLPCNGEELYSWASNVEEDICEKMDRFDASDNKSKYAPTHNIDHIYAITKENILFDNKPITLKILVLLDDLHILTKSQRAEFLDKIIHTRFPMPIWIAERLESLDLDDLVIERPGREYNTVYLERKWEHTHSFESFVRTISGKRSNLAELDFDVEPLHKCLEENIEHDFTDISHSIQKRLLPLTNKTKSYEKWVKELGTENSSHKYAVRWRSLEIKIARNERNAQQTLDNIPLEINADNADLNLESIAEFFIHDEFSIPYFFGFSKIAKLATYNIEQFLEIVSEIFDDIISQQTKDKNKSTLKAKRQEKIIKKFAKEYYDSISKNNKNGIKMVNFLDALRQFAVKQTKQPNAPYAPGVTGIGITKKSYTQLIDSENKQKNEKYYELAKILQSCISNNYLKVNYHAKQGKKGSESIVFYLNRLFCAHFDLPLGRGGWRHKNLDELCNWLDMSSKPTNQEERIINEF